MKIATLAACLTLPRTALAECGDGTFDEDGSEQCDDGNLIAGDGCSETCRVDCTRVGEAATQHTCTHGQFGPFMGLPAQAYPGFIYTDVSQPHTYFTVTLSGEPEANRSGVLFWPVNDGDYAVYLKENYPVTLYTEAGEEVPLLLEHAITTCPRAGDLGWVKVYTLSFETSYHLVIGPTTGATASFALEYLRSFQSLLYRDRDGDGFGGDVTAAAWCDFVPGDWNAATGGEDCDDSDAAVYPGAAETCDGRDSDCGWDSDVGQDQLCDASPLGNRCVESAPVAVCGCSDDSDCGTVLVCNATTHRCEEPDDGEGGAPGGAAGAPHGSGGESGASTEPEGSAGESGGEAGAGARPGTSSGGSSGRGGAGGGNPKGGSAGRSDATGGTFNATGGKGGNGRAGTGAAGDEPAPAAESDGCGCRVAKRANGYSAHTLAIFFLAGVMRRRRVRAARTP